MNNHHQLHGAPDQPGEQEQRMAAALDVFITALDDKHPSAMPAALAPDDQAAFDMATRLRRQLPRAAESPSADFVVDLGARLATLLADTAEQASAIVPPPVMPIVASPLVAEPNAAAARSRPAKRTPSRRAMLARGLSAAAGLAAGVAGGIIVDRVTQEAAPTGSWGIALVSGNGVWQAVAHVTEIAPGTVKRFTTTNLVGHLIRRTDGSFYALSAACTHMGCIVDWNVGQHTFNCPCHNGRFDGQGTALPNQPFPYRPLPAIATKVSDDAVYVWVPAPVASPTASATPDTIPGSGETYGGK